MKKKSVPPQKKASCNLTGMDNDNRNKRLINPSKGGILFITVRSYLIRYINKEMRLLASYRGEPHFRNGALLTSSQSRRGASYKKYNIC